MMPCSSPPRAITGLIVEHGSKAAENARRWLTMVKIRPLEGSTATTAPFACPRASVATWRISGSSYCVTSYRVGSPYNRAGALRVWRIRVVGFAAAFAADAAEPLTASNEAAHRQDSAKKP